MKYFIDPFGCFKNQVDAETMMAFLNKDGWVFADAEEADVIIVNSCGFIERAKQESINAAIGWRALYPNKKIVLAGCLSQRYASELEESLTEVDVIFGNKDLSNIRAAVSAVVRGEGRGTAAGYAAPEQAASSDEIETVLPERPLLSLPGSAYIKISEGCDNRCAFCSIPFIRGRLRSRTIPAIVGECSALLMRGVKELCLIGQDIGSFGMDRGGTQELPDLLAAISALSGDFWVRLLYIHPEHVPLQILALMQNDTRFLPYFDLPFQHGSASILKAMNRQQCAEDYLALLAAIRSALPDAVVRSTFLLGFPGETEKDMDELLDFQEKATLDWLGCFTYSREEYTSAYSMKNRVSKKTALERKQRVERKQTAITELRMERFIGRSLDMLIEEAIQREDLYFGRLFCHAPEVDGSVVISSDAVLETGTFIRGAVFARTGYDLHATVLPSHTVPTC
ncbi:MAG: 30S ribosomal protein S12 methylthiotransferase RimO [Treponema sp.]|jgi:ribosomal protein S12 methylthiotransferase|nr:30S ribosomal protein S12 methylthiotransferase RimO [Treponema sp.]